MSTLPEELPHDDEAAGPAETDAQRPLHPWTLHPPPEAAPLAAAPSETEPPAPEPEAPDRSALGSFPDPFSAGQAEQAGFGPIAPSELPYFASFGRPEVIQPPRIPHLGHVVLLALLALLGLLSAGLLSQAALHFHLFGVTTSDQEASDIHYTLGSEAILYLVMLTGAWIIFPLLWHKSFLAGISWRGGAARRLRSMLISAAFVCFLLAIVNGWLMPGPPDAPIDRMFRIPGAAWLLFAFGVTFAPFFEELAFRGFLLPALCTACDWTAEKAAGKPPRPLDADGAPQWSLTAMLIASLLTSLPFAGMHAAQTGYSWGPFLLLVCVSLVLCWARLAARSLAASVLVHCCYNFMLFSLMLFGTGGFRHLENM
jgi:uncharacterized protein